MYIETKKKKKKMEGRGGEWFFIYSIVTIMKMEDLNLGSPKQNK